MYEKIRVWDLPVRVFHWSLAASVIIAYTFSESDKWRVLHVSLGYLVVALIVFRIAWGFVGTRFARFSSFAYGLRAVGRDLRGLARGGAEHATGHPPAGSWAIYALLLVGLATGLTGWLHYEAIGGDALGDAHEALANLWIGLVAVHVAGVVIASLRHRENLVAAMLNGTKLGRPDEAIPTVRPVVGLLVCAAVAAGGGWAVSRGIDAAAAARADTTIAESTMRDRRDAEDDSSHASVDR